MLSWIFMITVLCSWKDCNATNTSIVNNSKVKAINASVGDKPTSPYAVDCVLRLVDDDFKHYLDVLLTSGVKVIDYDIKFSNYYDEILERKGGSIYKWNHWMRTVDNRGRSLLMLDENYELLSLNSMKIGVKEINVTLLDEPHACLSALTVKDTTDLIRKTILNDFKSTPVEKGTGSPSDAEDHVCNMYVKDENGYAQFLYTCCHFDENQEFVCADVEQDSWMTVLKVFVISVKVLIVMFSPLLIPQKFYRTKFTAAEYHYHVPAGDGKKRLRVVATRDPESYESSNKVVKLDRVQGMEFFKTMLNTMHLDKIYEMKLSNMRLSVSCHRLLEQNSVPVSVFRYFYDSFCRCKIRNAAACVSCCYSSICGNVNFGFKTIAWYKCLMPFMRLIQLILLTLPWIIRIVIFMKYEQDQENKKSQKAADLGLKEHFRGSLTLLLTPLHGVFLTCYVLLLLDAIIYGTLGQSVKEKLRMVFTVCLRDMKEKSKLNVCSWAINLGLVPFTSFGFLGVLLAVPFWIILSPVYILVFVFYFIPTINLTIRMMIHFFILLCPQSLAMKCRILMAKTKPINSKLKLAKLAGEESFRTRDDMSKKEVCFQYLIIIICILSFLSLTFLVMECISFFVEIAVYTTIGIIINAQKALQYISVISLFILYSRDCFGKLHKKYLNFHKVIVGQLLQREKVSIETTARSDAEFQENTVFRVKSNNNDVQDITLLVKDGEIKWKTAGFLVFLNQEDRPFFPEKFFFRVIEMKYHGSPGPVYYSIFRSIVEFFKIIIFIIFIIIVVMAFGDVYSISPANQLIATGAGGLLPFAVRHFFAKKGEATFNVDSVQFKAEFNRILSKFQQSWPVYDIVPEKYQELHSQYSVPANLDRDVFVDAEDEIEDDNNDDDRRIMMTSSTNTLLTDEGAVDLVVDVSNFSERFRAKVNNKTFNGSLSMLAQTYRQPRNNNTGKHDDAYLV